MASLHLDIDNLQPKRKYISRTDPECCPDTDCASYRGKVNITVEGLECMPWSQLREHKKFLPEKYAIVLFKNHLSFNEIHEDDHSPLSSSVNQTVD